MKRKLASFFVSAVLHGVIFSCAAWPQNVAAAINAPQPWARAAVHAGVCWTVLYGIALRESRTQGVTFTRPWPWTVNSPEGPQYFKTRAAAKRHIETLIENGQKNIDVGLMQINWRYHGHRVDWSVDALLDPSRNVMVAAEYLAETMRETNGDLKQAVGWYHNRRPERAEPYASWVLEAAKAMDKQGSCSRWPWNH
ncbi:MAG: transglycosylase SLT domain-containing protein [Salinisphaeraceae bacterium]